MSEVSQKSYLFLMQRESVRLNTSQKVKHQWLNKHEQGNGLNYSNHSSVDKNLGV